MAKGKGQIVDHRRIIEDLERLAKSGNLSHGYIFFGSSVADQRAIAWSFANFLETGKFLETDLLQDAVLIHPNQKGVLGIDEVRKLKSFLWQKPVVSKYRTAIVDRAELLTQEAQNALLKVAEEPPISTLLILVTSDIEALPLTLRSRLHGIYFSDFGKQNVVGRIAEDKKLQDYVKSAEILMKLPRDKRRDFIKSILEDETFNLNEFLDAMIVKMSSTARSNSSFWHKLLKLRGEAAYFNLNPRLQLDNLMRDF